MKASSLKIKFSSPLCGGGLRWGVFPKKAPPIPAFPRKGGRGFHFLVVVVLFQIFGSLSASAQAATGRAGTASADFLKLGVGARYLAMGEAATAVADDANAIFWNPANIARLKRSSISFTY